MKAKSKRALYIFLASVLLLIACDVSSFAASQQVPTLASDAIQVIVAQTAGAAATQTAAFLPPTLTPTFTPFPTQIPSETPTITPTFIFIVNTPTGGIIGTSSPFACTFVSQSPQDGTSFNTNQAFTLNWKVKNTGSSDWLQNNVDLDYVSGKKFTSTTIVNLPKNVASGDTVTLTVSMTAPGASGTYTTNWTLAAGSQTFCPLYLKIKVK